MCYISEIFSFYSLLATIFRPCNNADEVDDRCALNTVWETYDSTSKERVCQEIWAMIKQLREIPKPSELRRLYQCNADGPPSHDALLQDLDEWVVARGQVSIV